MNPLNKSGLILVGKHGNKRTVYTVKWWALPGGNGSIEIVKTNSCLPTPGVHRNTRKLCGSL